jgi:hypothetical protein
MVQLEDDTSMLQVPMNPIWTPYGPLWTPMDPLWTLYGPPMDLLWPPYGPPMAPQDGHLSDEEAAAVFALSGITDISELSGHACAILSALNRKPGRNKGTNLQVCACVCV